MATCFVIMPVTTPDNFLSTYNNDGAHFHHVLEHLFRPALEQLNFEVISPVARGAELIHAEIIRNLETADLVLCDMSIVNPNVFFELGVRTALNRPVCLVRDDVTERVPFDTGIINSHTYLSDLAPWTLDNQVQQLKEHISDSVEGSNGNNALWRYFGLSHVATPPAEETSVDAKIDRLTLQVEGLSRKLDTPEVRVHRSNRPSSTQISAFTDDIHTFLANKGITGFGLRQDDWDVSLYLNMEKSEPHELHPLFNIAERYGFGLEIKATG